MKRSYSHPRTLIPEVYFKKGKAQRHEIRVKYNNDKTAAKVKVTGEVIKASLIKGGEFGFYTVTLKTNLSEIKDVCVSAMQEAFHDPKVFKLIPRTSEEEFVQKATHSILKGGLFLKRKYYCMNGKNSEPSFYCLNMRRIHPKSIGPKSVVELSFKFESYCVDGLYGLRGVLEKDIVVHKLVLNSLDNIPYEF